MTTPPTPVAQASAAPSGDPTDGRAHQRAAPRPERTPRDRARCPQRSTPVPSPPRSFRQPTRDASASARVVHRRRRPPQPGDEQGGRGGSGGGGDEAHATRGLLGNTVADLVAGKQCGNAKTFSAFTALETITLAPGESVTLASFYGQARAIEDLPKIAARVSAPGFAAQKLERARALTNELTAGVETHTASHLFDGAVKQACMDNSLRGGMPPVLGDLDDNMRQSNADEDSRPKVGHRHPFAVGSALSAGRPSVPRQLRPPRPSVGGSLPSSLSTAASPAPVDPRLSAAHASTTAPSGARQPVAPPPRPTLLAVSSAPVGLRIFRPLGALLAPSWLQ
jgi:hypothetical protein